MGTVTVLPTAASQVSWSVLSPCDHAVQIYADDGIFLEGLEGYVADGLRAGEAVVVIATAMHLHGLEARLRARAVDVDLARMQNRYLPRLAEDVLASFMDGDWPDEAQFTAVIERLVGTARGNPPRKVRAFSEMVAILWARGNHAATIHLELLGSKFCAAERLPLFCAYPRDTFARNATESIVEICRIHSRVAPPRA